MNVWIDTVKTDVCSMDYLRFGAGDRTLVILLGLSVQRVAQFAQMTALRYAALAKAFTVYILDRRSELPNPYPVAEMAEDTAAALRALGLRDVCLFGASQGGMIAMTLAIRYPELVQRLALGSTSARVTEEQFQAIGNWIELARRKDREGLYLDFGAKLYPPGVAQVYRSSLIAAARTVTDEELARFIILAEGSRGFDVTEQLHRLQCPVFVIGVADDAVLDGAASEEIAERLRGQTDCRLFMYRGFGHAAFDVAPDYQARLLDFFAASGTGNPTQHNS